MTLNTNNPCISSPSFLDAFKKPQVSSVSRLASGLIVTGQPHKISFQPAKPPTSAPNHLPDPVWPDDFPKVGSQCKDPTTWARAFTLHPPRTWAIAMLRAVRNKFDTGTEADLMREQIKYLAEEGPDYLFEVILSAAEPTGAQLMYKALTNPTSPLSAHIIRRLYTFHTAGAVPPHLSPSREINDATRTLTAVDTLEMAIKRVWPEVPALNERPPSPAIGSPAVDEDGDIQAMFGVGVKASQKQAKKRARKVVKNRGLGAASEGGLSAAEEESFRRSALTVPTNVKEAWGVWNESMESMRFRSLETFITSSESPELVDYLVVKHFIKPAAADAVNPFPTVPTNSDVSSKATPSSSEADLCSSIPSAYPSILPMKAAALASTSISASVDDTFGSWRLLLSNKAISALRQMRDSGKIFHIVVKKMQQLSHGHFSDDNSKVLVGLSKEQKGTTVVPIYEAKITRDLRLIYEVAIAPDAETERDEQVLKVWAICNHRQIDGRLFALLAAHSAHRSPEYKRRSASLPFRTPGPKPPTSP